MREKCGLLSENIKVFDKKSKILLMQDKDYQDYISGIN